MLSNEHMFALPSYFKDIPDLRRKQGQRHPVERKAHYHFTVKGNQPQLQEAIALLFQDRAAPDFLDVSPPDHGRIETRRIWCSTALNAYLDFPHVGQVFMIERERVNKKSGELSIELALGITSHSPEQANAQCVLATNRGHWVIENSCHYIIDWNYHEDRSRICVGHGPANVTRLRRFAIGILKPRFSISPLLRLFKRLNLREKNQKLFVNVE